MTPISRTYTLFQTPRRVAIVLMLGTCRSSGELEDHPQLLCRESAGRRCILYVLASASSLPRRLVERAARVRARFVPNPSYRRHARPKLLQNAQHTGSHTILDGSSVKMSESADTNGESMRIDAQRAKLLAENLGHVFQRLQSVSGGRKVCLQDR